VENGHINLPGPLREHAKNEKNVDENEKDVASQN